MFESSLFKALCFWRPAINYTAIDHESCSRFKIDKETVLIRSVALTAIACLVIPLALKVSFFLVAPVIIAVNYNLPLPRMLEKWRCSRVLNQLAIQIINKKNHIHSEVISHIVKSPKVVRDLLSQNLFKNSSAAHNLTKVILLDFNSCTNRRMKDKFAIIIKEMIVAGTFQNGEINHNLLRELLKGELDFNSPVIDGLQKNTINLSDLTDEMVRKLWSDVKEHKNNDLADILIKKGFNIDLKNDKGQTLLLEAIGKNNISQVCFLLKHGAKLPLDDEIILVRDNSNPDVVKEIPLNECLKDKPSLSRALYQAYSAQADVPFLNHQDPSPLAFLKPAVRIGGWSEAFEVNAYTIYSRTVTFGIISAVALGILTLSTSSLLVPLVFTVTLIPTIWHVCKYERERAAWSINNIAIAEFKNAFPYSGVVKYIASNPQLLQELLDVDPAAPFKFDGQAKSLWDYICKYNDLEYDDETAIFVFKMLADFIFNENAVNPLSIQEKQNHFARAIKSGSQVFVEHLLSQEKIRAEEFDENLQFECWAQITKMEMISMFVNYGFNIDARSAEGWTPLLWNLSKGHSYGIIKALLEAGADVTATMILGDKRLNVLDFAHNGNVRQLLKKYLAK